MTGLGIVSIKTLPGSTLRSFNPLQTVFLEFESYNVSNHFSFLQYAILPGLIMERE